MKKELQEKLNSVSKYDTKVGKRFENKGNVSKCQFIPCTFNIIQSGILVQLSAI